MQNPQEMTRKKKRQTKRKKKRTQPQEGKVWTWSTRNVELLRIENIAETVKQLRELGPAQLAKAMCEILKETKVSLLRVSERANTLSLICACAPLCVDCDDEEGRRFVRNRENTSTSTRSGSYSG